MAKIKTLTAEQIAKFPAYVEKWTKIGLSTDPADRPKAEEGIVAAYAVAKLPPPRVVWCSSPFAMGFTRALLMDKKFQEKIGASVWASVWDSVGASVWDSGYGQHDADFIGFYDYLRTECNLAEQTEKLQGLTQLTSSAGWYLPHEKICWISERHCVVHQDENRRIHCEDGPAIAYPDGWAIHAIHGVRVPEYVVERPEEITTEKIDAEKNSEVRRVMLDRFGWDRYLESGGAVMLDRDETATADPVELYRKDVPGDEPLVMVKLINSTPEPDGSTKKYLVRVPPEHTKALDALAWTFEMSASDYRPMVET